MLPVVKDEYLRSIKWQSIVEQKRSLTFVILSEYGILYGTLLATYVGQYVENESLMYEPCVRNRRVAPEKIDILSNDRYSFLTIEKERKKTEKESNISYCKISVHISWNVFDSRNTIVNCRYNLIVSIRMVAVTSDEFFDDPSTFQLLIFSLLYGWLDRLKFQESSKQ